MIAIGLLFLRMLCDCFKPQQLLEADLVLRHQLNVLQRHTPRRRRQLRWADRALFIWLYRRYPRILDAVTIVRPQTVVRWHRKGFAAYWRWKSSSPGGRPRIALNLSTPQSAILSAIIFNALAPAMGLQIVALNASTVDEIDAAFAAFARERADALLVAADGFLNSRRGQFAILAARDRLPMSAATREAAEAGGLMSYGTNLNNTFRQVGIYAGSIVKGAKPDDLPVLQSTRFEFVINLQTARALGLEVPPMLLARADEVIE